MVRLSDDDTQPKSRMMFAQYKPHTGSSASKNESLETVLNTYHKTTPEKAKDAWIHQYEWSVANCKYVSRNIYGLEALIFITNFSS